MRPFMFRRAAAQLSDSRLREHAGFGPNPGGLRLFAYKPRGLPPGAPLVVILHGCKQDAHGYDHGAGWSRLAERFGFVLLAPEQVRAVNPNGCFDWFLPVHTRRGLGEAASIAAMIAWAIKTYACDPPRVFITGLSAGGAMTSVMLATYPEIFAAGAVIAGLPYDSAQNVPQAFAAMQAPADRSPDEWGEAVRQASQHQGPWPRVSLWHGDADQTVAPANMVASIRQWVNVHGAAHQSEDEGNGFKRRVWHDEGGRPVVEAITLAGLGHGTPIGEGIGHAAPYILEAGISSSLWILRFFGIAGREARPGDRAHWGRPGLRAVIEKALRVAGLRR